MNRCKIFSLICFIVSFIFANADEKIKMNYEHGVYTIPCEVNGLKLQFVFDTGAADVNLSIIEAAFMLKNGYIKESDFAGSKRYSMANGDVEENDIVILREIKIGSIVLKDVKACISSKLTASLLLGQSAIRKLGSYTVDGNYLILKSSEQPSSGTNYYASRNSNQMHANLLEKQQRYANIEDPSRNYKSNDRIEYSNGSVYVGDTYKGIPQGRGTYTWKSGDKYVGTFENGVKEGYGTYYWADGTKYEGYWKNNKIEGYGEKYYKNGNKYSGTWKDGDFNGNGIFVWAGGDRYEGAYLNGERSGYGTYYWKNKDKYVGYWEHNKRNGNGTYYYATGGSKTGTWKDGEYIGKNSSNNNLSNTSNNSVSNYSNDKDAKQTITYKNGAVYEGPLVNGKPHGIGTQTWPDGDNYRGFFKDGIRSGYGIYTWASGEKYEGYWENGDMNGQGTKYYTNGDIYKGKWVNDKQNGWGIYTWPNGDKYEGYFKEGKFNGEGTYYYASGSSKTGTWKDGKYVESKYSNSNKDVDFYVAEIKTASYLYETKNAGKYQKRLAKGALVMVSSNDKGDKYRKVLDIESDKYGYVLATSLGNLKKIEIDKEGNLKVEGRIQATTSSVKIKNNTNLYATITIGNSDYSFSPYEERTINNLTPGTYVNKATAPGVMPYLGYDTLEAGYIYSWVFYIEHRKSGNSTPRRNRKK